MSSMIKPSKADSDKMTRQYSLFSRIGVVMEKRDCMRAAISASLAQAMHLNQNIAASKTSVTIDYENDSHLNNVSMKCSIWLKNGLKDTIHIRWKQLNDSSPQCQFRDFLYETNHNNKRLDRCLSMAIQNINSINVIQVNRDEWELSTCSCKIGLRIMNNFFISKN
ncbi:hypothetical protein BpHYR1_006858 [Brachionus plicatilis]|uniref:Uncharacterized protein n=1 Tax=Brachionus plicatilis TaxID=10195 RepID=A0A3M7PAC2_BRAPC|nr:hypothetical protein BpHYR1_006858 [Brachionus plicatilis]